MTPPPSRHGRPRGSRPLHEVLLLLGGSMALVLGPVSLLVGIPAGLTDFGLLAAVVVDVVGGLVLILAVRVLRRSPGAGFLLALGVSLTLLGLGNLAGVLVAPFTLVGAVYGLLTHPARRRVRLRPARGFLLRRSRPRPPRS